MERVGLTINAEVELWCGVWISRVVMLDYSSTMSELASLIDRSEWE